MKKILLSISMVALAMSANAQNQETVYFQDDFEWLQPWADCTNNSAKKVAGNTVGTNDADANCPQFLTPVVDEVNGVQALEAKGYELLATYCKESGKSAREAGKQTYIQMNYIKFGLTDYFSGIKLPAMADFGEGASNVKISFDWCPMKKGSKQNFAFDKTELVVVVVNGTDEKQYLVEPLTIEDNADFKWYPTTVDLKDATLTKDTRIVIRNIDAQWPSTTKGEMLRWFFDNVKVYAAAQGSAVAEVEVAEDAPVEYYNLQGVRVANPENGLFIVKQGNKVSKKIFK